MGGTGGAGGGGGGGGTVSLDFASEGTGGTGGGGGGKGILFNVGGGGGAGLFFDCEKAANENRTQMINKFTLNCFIIIFYYDSIIYLFHKKTLFGNRVCPVGLGKLFHNGFPERLLFNPRNVW